MKTNLCIVASVAVGFTALPVLCMNTSDVTKVYDIPRLANTLTIDGSGDDWGGKGLRVTAWAEDGVPPLDPALCSAELRVGWTPRGLAALVELRSAAAWHESDDIATGYMADSIEVFVRRGSEWKNLVQAVITPGMTPAYPAPRSYIYDYRGEDEAWQSMPTTVEVARARSAGGCVLEVLMPWEQIAFDAAPGAVCEFSIKINKTIPGGGKRQFTWLNATGDAFQHLRLAKGSRSMIDTAAWAVRDGVERFGICAVAPAARTNTTKTLLVRQNGHELARAALASANGRASACLWLPIPETREPLALVVGGKHVTQIPVPDVRAEARRELERAARPSRRRFVEPITQARVTVPALLTTDTLPNVAGIHPRVAALAGIERMDVRWFGPDFAPVTRAERPGRYGCVVTLHASNEAPVIHYLTCVRPPDDFSLFAPVASAITKLAGTNAVDAQTAMALSLLQQRAHTALESDRDLAIVLAGALEAAADGQPIRPIARDRAWWHTLRTKRGLATTYTYFKLLPKEYDAQPGTRWPAIIYLHGSGGELPRDYTPLDQRTPDRDLIGWAQSTNLPVAIYALQSFGWWEPPAVIDTLKKILSEDRIDPDRVVVMGFSMGGMGTWECAIDYPEYFAAAVPIAGSGYRAFDCGTLAGRMPVWVFNGDIDLTTRLSDAERAVNALKAAGGDVRLTVLPNTGHGGSQNGTFNTPGLWEWVLAQRRTTLNGKW